MKFLPATFKIWLLKLLYKDIASLGDGGDTELAHINKKESDLLIYIGGSGTLNVRTGLREYKGGGGGGSSTTNNNIDPAVLPYILTGLEEAKGLYNEGAPDYYPGQTYIDPSSQSTSAMGLAEARALGGNPLVPAAQAQQLSTIQGDRLSAGNPYFADMMASSARPAVTEFNKAINNVTSTASQAGRYGSGAMDQMAGTASSNLANQLTSRAAELGYNNYNAERGRQDQAIASAPQMAQADYTDINQLANVGQTSEGYTRDALQGDINRYEYGVNAPQQQLQSYLSAAYGAPTGTTSTTQKSGGGK